MGINSLVHHLSKQSTLSIATKEHFRITNGLRNRTPSSQLFHFISLAILGTVTNINLIPIFADAKAIPRVYLSLYLRSNKMHKMRAQLATQSV